MKKDMLDRKAAGRWLEFIAAHGDDKILQFVQVVESECSLQYWGGF